jgi:beta-glucosidase-like glycosyl hydrolase
MCSYNQINNSYGCHNSYNLNYLLKNELDFQGFVMSDWQAQHSGVGDILAGLDMVSLSLHSSLFALTSARRCQETPSSRRDFHSGAPT